jgi:hypothetical protein
VLASGSGGDEDELRSPIGLVVTFEVEARVGLRSGRRMLLPARNAEVVSRLT